MCGSMADIQSPTAEIRRGIKKERRRRRKKLQDENMYGLPYYIGRPQTRCHAVTLPRRKSCWNLQGCPKLANGSQPLVSWSSPYYEDMWRRYRCLTSFFWIVDTCLSCEYTARQSCLMVPKWRFLRPVFSASRVQHISDMHSKFALRPHHVWKYGRHPISDGWD